MLPKISEGSRRMKEARVFTEGELEEMGKRTRDLIDEAIDNGKLEDARG